MLECSKGIRPRPGVLPPTRTGRGLGDIRVSVGTTGGRRSVCGSGLGARGRGREVGGGLVWVPGRNTRSLRSVAISVGDSCSFGVVLCSLNRVGQDLLGGFDVLELCVRLKLLAGIPVGMAFECFRSDCQFISSWDTLDRRTVDVPSFRYCLLISVISAPGVKPRSA